MLGFGSYEEGLLVEIGINALLGLSVYVILATGQLSLGNAAFMAVGAYLTGVLTVNSGLPLLPALLVAGLAAGALGIAIGFPALRFHGVYLAMATLAFGEIVRTFFLNFEPTGGTAGFSGMPGVETSTVLLVVAVLFGAVLALERSPVWLRFRAVSDDEDAAEVMGVRTTLVKTAAFGFGGFLAAVGGGLFAHHSLYVEPNNFDWLVSIDMVLFVILGGSLTAWGPLAGAAVLTLLPEWLRFMADWREAVFGGLLVLMLLVRPQGLLSRGMLGQIARALRIAPRSKLAEPPVASPTPAGGARSTGVRTPSPSSADGLLRLDGVRKRFGGVVALDDVSLSAPRGAIIGLIGPNGAGKTTVFNVVTNVVPPDGGAVSFAGQELAGLRPHQVARTGVARTFQNTRLFENLTVEEHLRVVQRSDGDGALGAAGDSGIEEILRLTGLQDVRDQSAASLAYGMQRRVEIARALALDPRILLLDEPAAGMNATESARLSELLLDLRERELTILLIEHDMPFVMSLCDRLFVLNFGSLIAQGTPDEVRSDPIVLEAYLGEEEDGADGAERAEPERQRGARAP